MTWWSMMFLGAIVLVAVVTLVWGWRGFNTNRARNVKHLEHAEVQRGLQQHIVLVARTHPEVVRVSRLDRHPFYLVLHLCIFGYAMCVFGGAELTNNVKALGDTTRFTMATSFVLGSILVISACTLGGTLFGRTIKPSVRSHPTCDALGDDVSLPYRVGSAGMAIVAVGAAIYSLTSFKSTAGSLGGWLSGGLAVASVVTIILMYVRTRFFEKWEAVLLDEARTRMESHGDADG